MIAVNPGLYQGGGRYMLLLRKGGGLREPYPEWDHQKTSVLPNAF